ncbi:MAG TPA: hypothetical protein ENI23_15060 [bacterium]|nr:hypothetical protein [bacterium]
MKIQFISDLHLEYDENFYWMLDNPIPVEGDVLVLAGDICPITPKGTPFYNRYEELLQQIDGKWDHIIILPGNHEFYFGADPATYSVYYHTSGQSISVVNNKTLTIGNVRFLCTTLWSFIRPQNVAACLRGNNDFSFIKVGGKPLNAEVHNALHVECTSWLNIRLMEKWDGPTVVISHHLPDTSLIQDKHKGSNINDCYASNLGNFIASHPEIKAWIHGHSHGFLDKMIGETRVLRNPLGNVSRGEHREHKPGLFIEV